MATKGSPQWMAEQQAKSAATPLPKTTLAPTPTPVATQGSPAWTEAQRAKSAATPIPKSTTGVPSSVSPLGIGSVGDEVKRLQESLNANGANLKVDGAYGPATQAAVNNASNKLANDIEDEKRVQKEAVITEKITTNKVATDKVNSDNKIATQAQATKLASDKLISDKAIADKLASDKVVADKQFANEQAKTEEINSLLTYIQEPNQYIEKLKTTTFDYSPLSDPAYQENSAGLENQVAQMMVGRGGLYSSVASAALQSRLMSLQVDMIGQKRQEFVEDRNFTLALAQNEMTNRNNYFNQIMAVRDEAAKNASTAFNQRMATAQFAAQNAQNKWDNEYKVAVFQADRQDKANQLAMQREQLRVSQVNAQLTYQLAKAKDDLAQKTTQVSSNLAELMYLQDDFDKISKKWTNSSNGATSEVVNWYAQYGVKIGIGSKKSQNLGADASVGNMLVNMENSIRNDAYATGQATDIYKQLDALNNPTTTQDVTTETTTKDSKGNITKTTKKGTEIIKTGGTPTTKYTNAWDMYK